jgi:hypothetical protein
MNIDYTIISLYSLICLLIVVLISSTRSSTGRGISYGSYILQKDIKTKEYTFICECGEKCGTTTHKKHDYTIIDTSLIKEPITCWEYNGDTYVGRTGADCTIHVLGIEKK